MGCSVAVSIIVEEIGETMFGAGLAGEALGVGTAVAGIGITTMGVGMIANQINQIVPNAQKKLREKG